MAFLDDAGSAPDTEEPRDPDADARAAALTPERGAYLAMEIDGLAEQLVARAIEMGMTTQGFLVTMAHHWRLRRRTFEDARATWAEASAKLAAKDSAEAEPARWFERPALTCKNCGKKDPDAGILIRCPSCGFPDQSCARSGCFARGPHEHDGGASEVPQKIGPFTVTNEGVTACPVVGCDEPQDHTHVVDGRVVIAGENANPIQQADPRETKTPGFGLPLTLTPCSVCGRTDAHDDHDAGPAPRATGTEEAFADDFVQHASVAASAITTVADWGSCPEVGCRIEGPHDHAVEGPEKEEPR